MKRKRTRWTIGKILASAKGLKPGTKCYEKFILPYEKKEEKARALAYKKELKKGSTEFNKFILDFVFSNTK